MYFKFRSGLLIILCLALIISISGCMAYDKNKGLNIFIHQAEFDYSRSSIIVFNFRKPNYTESAGRIAARTFHQKLLESKLFYMVRLNNNSSWDRYAETEEEMLKTAMAEAKALKTRFVLLGEVEDFIFGGLNKTRVKLKVRIIDVHSGVTYFMCSYVKTDIGKDKPYPLTTKITPNSMLPDRLLEEMAVKIIQKI